MVERLNLTDDYSISRVINGCWQLSVGHSIKSQLDKEDIMKAFTMLVEEGSLLLIVLIFILEQKNSWESLVKD